mmetsp:Transcript_46094/g.128150  ORF Transcript_46094/g.128150 Transcript_46094/m.128150 type:complete len:440 (-) Transcript_46094:232-1551(-)
MTISEYGRFQRRNFGVSCLCYFAGSYALQWCVSGFACGTPLWRSAGSSSPESERSWPGATRATFFQTAGLQGGASGIMPHGVSQLLFICAALAVPLGRRFHKRTTQRWNASTSQSASVASVEAKETATALAASEGTEGGAAEGSGPPAEGTFEWVAGPPVAEFVGQSPVGDATPDLPATTERVRAPDGVTAFEKVPPWFRGDDKLLRLTFAAAEGYGTRATSGPFLAGGARSNVVVVSVFDVGKVVPEKYQKGLQELKDCCIRPIDGLWHISIQAWGHTYDNPRGVDGILPFTLKEDLRYQFELYTPRSEQEWLQYFEEHQSNDDFDIMKYNMFDNNCNHSQADCVAFLAGSGVHLDLCTAPEVLSPLDFARREPDPKTHKLANIAITRGMLARREVMKEKDAETRRNIAICAVSAVAAAFFASRGKSANDEDQQAPRP